MNKLLQSKLAAAICLVVVFVLIIVTYQMRQQWWMFIDIFCAFMGVFCHLAALMLGKMSRLAAKKLDVIALIFMILFVLAFIGEYIAVQFVG